MIRLSVVIPTYRRARSVGRLLESLTRQTLPAEEAEILVVSNFPDAQLGRELAQWSGPYRLRELSPVAAGANASRNFGIAASHGEVVLLLDDDCLVNRDDFFEALLARHAEFPQALAIGGGYAMPENAPAATIAYNLITQDWQRSQTQGPAARHLLGGNVSYKRGPLAATGELFNAAISYGAAELEFHERLLRRGAELRFFPDLTVLHAPELAARDLPQKAFKQAFTARRFGLGQTEAPLDRTYQGARVVNALRFARTPAEHAEVCRLLGEYDDAYQLVARGEVASWPALRRKLRRRAARMRLSRWLRRST